MVIVIASVETNAETLASLREALLTMQEASRAEPGCHDYTFSQELGDPNRLRVVEIWDSMDALREHFGMPHMATFRAALAATPPQSMDLRVHELGERLELPS